MPSQVQTRHWCALKGSPARKLLRSERPASERSLGVAGVPLQIQRRAMHARNDVLAEMGDELFGATNEHIANLLLVALPVDARRIEGGVSLLLE